MPWTSGFQVDDLVQKNLIFTVKPMRDCHPYFVVHCQTGSKGSERSLDQGCKIGQCDSFMRRQKWSAWHLLGVASSFEMAVDMAWQPRSEKIQGAYNVDFDYTITSFKWLDWKLANAEFYFVPKTDTLYNANRFQNSWVDAEGNTVPYKPAGIFACSAAEINLE